jgi:hypothetical protein
MASIPIWPFQGFDKLMMLYGLAIMGQILDFKGQIFIQSSLRMWSPLLSRHLY